MINNIKSRNYFFVILSIICTTASLYFISTNVSRVYNFEKSRWEVLKKPNQFSSVVLGNSHSRGLYFTEVEKVYYLSSSGEDLFESFYKAKKSIREMDDLKCLFIAVSLSASHHTNKFSNNNARAKFYNINKSFTYLENDIEPYVEGLTADLIRPDKWTPVIKRIISPNLDGKLTTKNDSKNGWIEPGSFRELAEPNKVKEKATQRGNYHNALINENTSQSQRDIIEHNFIEQWREFNHLIMQENDLFVVYFQPPYLSEYKEQIDIERIRKTNEIFNSSQLASESILYYQALAPSWQNAKFYNDDHLNILGAAQFTKEFEDFLKKKKIDCF